MSEDLRICDKKRYETEEDARDTIIHIMISDDWAPDLSPYKCHTCHNWHLTKRNKQ